MIYESLLDQELLDQITQILIKSHYKRMFTKEFIDMTCVTLFNLMTNSKINMNFLLEKLLDEATKNINCLNFTNQRFILNAYRIFIDRAGYTKISVFFKMVKKMVKFVSEDISIGILEKMEIINIIELVDIIARFEVSAPEFILEAEKIVGKNINEIPPHLYLIILDSFVKSKSYRDKFIVLLQNKISENKENIPITDLCRIMRIFAVLKLANQTFFEIMQEYLLSLKNHMNDEEITNFIFAYSNLNISNNHVLNDLENTIEEKVITWAQNRQYVLLIDVFQSYLIAKKGEKIFIEKMKNIILHSNLNSEEIEEVSVCKLYKIFVELKLTYNEIKSFDNLLRHKLKYYEKEEFEALRNFLQILEYKNEKTKEMIDHLITIADDPNKILSYLSKFELV
jgi:hypothetical protein